MVHSWFWLLGILTRSGWADLPRDGVDVVIVPGCPTRSDGRLSECQWRRAAWAAHLYQEGLARHFITSGGAAHTPYVEATSIARGLEALGVPREVVFQETQALHTDQNAGYALAIVDALGFRTVGVASDPGHSDAMCRMAERWGRECTNFRMDHEVVNRKFAELPSVMVEPIPHERWVAEHREPRMATSDNYRSIRHYTGVILKGVLTGSRPPKPPGPEPTLRP